MGSHEKTTKTKTPYAFTKKLEGDFKKRFANMIGKMSMEVIKKGVKGTKEKA